MIGFIGEFTHILVLAAFILTGSIGWLLVRGRKLVPSKQNFSRSRRNNR